jgi:hypothetical protein
MRRSVRLHTVRRLATAALLLFATTPAFSQTIDPETCELTLDPGVLAATGLEVCVPGVEVGKADIFLLADNTASMGDVIASVQSGAATLTSTLLNLPDIDIQIGVGNYTDVPPFTPAPFSIMQPVTNDLPSIVSAINTWTFADGGDVAESQFYAMHRICKDPAIGFRPDAKRIIVWFGDSPAHDPICGPVLQLYGEPPVDLTEALLTDELTSTGPFGGTTVIAISTPFSQLVPDALDNDPLGPGGIFAEDYISLGCPQNGTAGQATRIANATSGISTFVTEPQAITDAILDAIESILTEVTITLQPTGDIAAFVTSVDPPEFVVQLPNDESQLECVEFTVNWEGQACAENTYVFEGGIDILVNGNPVATKDVVIEQPGCDEVMCLMYMGLAAASLPIPGGDPQDLLYLHPMASWPVLMDSVPSFAIPNDPALEGVRVYFQVGMYNAVDFPVDPLQVSNGLEVILGEGNRIYGQGTGIALYLEQPPLLGGVLEPGFVVEGM